MSVGFVPFANFLLFHVFRKSCFVRSQKSLWAPRMGLAQRFGPDLDMSARLDAMQVP